MNISIKKIEISNSIILKVLPIILVQLALPYRPLALFLIEKLHIPLLFLLIIEGISVPLTMLVVYLFLIQRLKWSWLQQKPFILGYVMAGLFHLSLIVLDAINPDVSKLLFHGYTEALATLSMPLLGWVLYLYRGWNLFSGLTILIYLMLFVTTPLAIGLLASLGNFVYRKIRRHKATRDK